MNYQQNQHNFQNQPPLEATEGVGHPDESEDVATWDDTVGSSQPFDINSLTNDEVLTMYQQGRGGPAIATRASRLQDVAEHDANMGFPDGTGNVIKSKEQTIQAQKDKIRRNEETMRRYQEQINAAQVQVDHLEVAKLQKGLTERRKLCKQFKEELERLQAD